jgi:hypothetical protein
MATSNRSDIYESGYDLPTHLSAPTCPECGDLFCYCPARYRIAPRATPAGNEAPGCSRHGIAGCVACEREEQ